MINIYELLNERLKYKFDGREDEWLDSIVKEKPENFSVLVPVSMFSFDYQLRKYGSILDEYNIKAVIKTRSPFPRTLIWFNIILFTKEDVDCVVLSTYALKPYAFDMKKAMERGRELTIRELTDDYQKFIADVNNSIKNSKGNNNIYVVDKSKFDKKVLNPECYSDSSMKIKEEIENKKNNFKTLSEMADINPLSKTMKIKESLFIDENSELIVRENRLHFDRDIMVCKAEQGDIVLKKHSLTDKFSICIVDEQHAGYYVDIITHCLIRKKKKKMIPYVLFCFSDPKTLYYFMSLIRGNSVNHLSTSDIKEIPILIPNEEMINNSKELYDLKKGSKDINLDDINKKIREIKVMNKSDSETRNIINLNISEALSILKTKMAYEVINDDLKELDTCYLNGAYKASIILCGSILEAILLDWLSEYEETEKITNVAVNEYDGRDKDLADIINELYRLVTPRWQEKNKAHEIRSKRNYVHPKVCLRNEIHLTDEDVKKIIEDLKDIIDSRLNRN